MSPLNYKEAIVISIHTPAWGATRGIISIRLIVIFQSTLPRGERLLYTKLRRYKTIFQSTLPRGERLFDQEDDTGDNTISIHTPAWGATWVIEFERCDKPISIHTPAWGATVQAFGRYDKRFYFNPHSRVGSDLMLHLQRLHGHDFNPHSRVGSDCKIAQKQF